jgi:hypothetical protein
MFVLLFTDYRQRGDPAPRFLPPRAVERHGHAGRFQRHNVRYHGHSVSTV